MYVLAPNHAVEVYPYSVSALRRDNPNVSFPRNPSAELLASCNVFPVVEQATPSYNPALQNLSQINPTLVAGKWLQTWQITDASAEEIVQRTKVKAAEVRQQRNKRLADCDWTQLSDAPVDATAWATYRQELRDVTAQVSFPWEITWPKAP